MKSACLATMAAALLLMACGHAEQPAGNGAGKTDGPLERHCYVRVTAGTPIVNDGDTLEVPSDSVIIHLDILGDLVNGTYDQLPQEEDQRTGSFTGTLEHGVITALYTSVTEDITTKEEVLFKMEPGGLRIGTGERVESEGLWLFKDKGRASFGEPVPEVACP